MEDEQAKLIILQKLHLYTSLKLRRLYVAPNLQTSLGVSKTGQQGDVASAV